MSNDFKFNQEELRQKYNPDGSVLRKAQLRMTEMLTFIDKVCRDNNLKYWLDSGTLLGARRHGGFIPWDDDTDICMTWKDAEKFKQIMLHNNPSEEFVLQCRETDCGFFGCWYVLRDLKTEYIQDREDHKKKKFRGLQVDIVPVEEKSFALLFRIASLIQNNLINRPLECIKSSQIAKVIALPSYYILRILIPLFRAVSPKRNFIRMCYGVKWRSKQIENTFPIDKTIKFENVELMCPQNVDGYLTDQYGNWQVLPEKIKTHNVTVVFYE